MANGRRKILTADGESVTFLTDVGFMTLLIILLVISEKNSISLSLP